jgi:hypothetical protein
MAAAAVSLVDGTLFAGRYRVRDRLGDGGMGTVYLVVDELLGEGVALKVALDVDVNSDPGVDDVAPTSHREAQRREVTLARRVTHPNVARVYDLGVHEALRYITMEHVPGTSLRRRLRDGPMAAATVTAIGHQIASALAAAHDAGVVHLDLKPDNVVVVDGVVPRAVLLDFGVSRALGERATGEGTLDFMAPEQLGDEVIGGAADVYALGLLLFELVTGQRAFGGETPMARALARLTHKPALLGEPVPPALSSLIDACLCRHPADRPSAHTVERELARSLADGGTLPGARGVTDTVAPVDLGVLPGDLGLRLAKARAALASVGTERDAVAVADEVLQQAPSLDVAIALRALALVRAWGQPRPQPAQPRVDGAPDERAGTTIEDVADRAVIAVSDAIARAPHLADAHVADALIADGAGDVAYAVRALRRALARDPLNAFAHESLGRLEIEAGVGGEQRVRVAYALDASHAGGLMSLARDFYLRGNDRDADALVHQIQQSGMHIREVNMLRWRLALWRDDRVIAADLLPQIPNDTYPVTQMFRLATNYILGTTSLEACVVAATGLLKLPTSPKRHAFYHQVLAELLARTDPRAAVGHVLSAAQLPLADLRWLDACPTLDGIRDEPGFRIAQATVQHRLDGVFGAPRTTAVQPGQPDESMVPTVKDATLKGEWSRSPGR